MTGRPDDRVPTQRLRAARRKALGLKMRRLVPGLVVGTSTLAGTGGLVAWVSHQPGLQVAATSGPPATRAAPAASAATGGTSQGAQVLAGVQKQLQAEEAALQALQAKLARLRQVNLGSAAGTPSPGAPAGSGAGSAPLPSVSPVPTLPPLPAVAVPVLAPAPATNATTGASHAIP